MREAPAKHPFFNTQRNSYRIEQESSGNSEPGLHPPSHPHRVPLLEFSRKILHGHCIPQGHRLQGGQKVQPIGSTTDPKEGQPGYSFFPGYRPLEPAPILRLVRSWRMSEAPWLRVLTLMPNWPAQPELSCRLVEPAERPGGTSLSPARVQARSLPPPPCPFRQSNHISGTREPESGRVADLSRGAAFFHHLAIAIP